MSYSQQDRDLSVSTPLGDDVLLLRAMRGRERISEPFRYELDLLSEQVDIDYDALLGQSVTVKVLRPDGGTRWFNGLVSQFSQVGFQHDLVAYKAVLVPWLWFLTRTADCRIYQQQTTPEIVKAVFRELGFSDFEENLNGSYRTWGFRVQYRESAFAFVSRLLEQAGIYYFFKHSDGKHTLVLADNPAAHETVSGYGTIPYHPPSQGLGEQEDITDWRARQRARSGAYTLTDYDFMSPGTDLTATRSDPKAHDLADFELFDYPGEYYSQDDGETYARLRLESVQADCATFEATTFARGPGTGDLFSLGNYPRDDQNQQYLILGADYRLVSDVFLSTAEARRAPVFRAQLTGIDAQASYRPGLRTQKPVVKGPQSAIVVGQSGEEVWTDQYARVKVQFLWDRYGKSDENSSCWIRVSYPWAGKAWGGIQVPRIGQEVIVDFLEGDPDRPLITGRVYNDDNDPPYPLPDQAVVSGVKTNSSKGGQGYNELAMDDTADSELIRIHAQKDMQTTVENDDTQSVNHDRTIAVAGTHTETIKGDTAITISEGNLTHEVSAGTADYKVKGALSETYADTQTTKVTGAVAETYEASQTTKANEKISITSSGDEIALTAATKIVLKAGASSISLAADGTIELTGVNIKISGDAEAKLASGANSVTCNTAEVNISGMMINSSADTEHKIAGLMVMIN